MNARSKAYAMTTTFSLLAGVSVGCIVLLTKHPIPAAATLVVAGILTRTAWLLFMPKPPVVEPIPIRDLEPIIDSRKWAELLYKNAYISREEYDAFLEKHPE